MRTTHTEMKKPQKFKPISTIHHIFSLTLVFLTVKLTQCSNLLTNFPEKIQIFKTDQVGYNLNRFINGSLIHASYYPQPFVKPYVNDKLVTYLSIKNKKIELSGFKLCDHISSDLANEFWLLCRTEVNSKDRLLYVANFDNNMKLIRAGTDNLAQGKTNEFFCSYGKAIDEYFFVVCLEELDKSGKPGVWNLILRVYTRTPSQTEDF